MPLIKATLELGLKKLLDQEYSGFVGFSDEVVGVANNWSQAINEYAKAIVPASTTFDLAEQAFKTVMLGITNTPSNGLVILSLAFTQYAIQLAIGMAGAGFTGTPPPIPIDFSSIVPVGLGGASGAQITILISTIIDIWFRTGTATPTSGGAIIPWS